MASAILLRHALRACMDSQLLFCCALVLLLLLSRFSSLRNIQDITHKTPKKSNHTHTVRDKHASKIVFHGNGQPSNCWYWLCSILYTQPWSTHFKAR